MFLERKSMQTLHLGLVTDPRPSLEGDQATCIDACSPLAPWQLLDAPGGPGAEAVSLCQPLARWPCPGVPGSGQRSRQEAGHKTLPEHSILEDLLQFTVKFGICFAFSLSKLGAIHKRSFPRNAI